jgi:hypothetical protein
MSASEIVNSRVGTGKYGVIPRFSGVARSQPTHGWLNREFNMWRRKLWASEGFRLLTTLLFFYIVSHVKYYNCKLLWNQVVKGFGKWINVFFNALRQTPISPREREPDSGRIDFVNQRESSTSSSFSLAARDHTNSLGTTVPERLPEVIHPPKVKWPSLPGKVFIYPTSVLVISTTKSELTWVNKIKKCKVGASC